MGPQGFEPWTNGLRVRVFSPRSTFSFNHLTSTNSPLWYQLWQNTIGVLHDLRRSAITEMNNKNINAAQAGTHLTGTASNRSESRRRLILENLGARQDPKKFGVFAFWWAPPDSNREPSDYEPLALTIELGARRPNRITKNKSTQAGVCAKPVHLADDRKGEIGEPRSRAAGSNPNPSG